MKTIEFGVELPPRHIDGKWYVAGRCYTDISLGLVFSLVIQRKWRAWNPEEPIPEPDELGRFTTNLRLTEILSYQKRLDWIGKSMSALLILIGDGAHLTDNCLLVGEGYEVDTSKNPIVGAYKITDLPPEFRTESPAMIRAK